MSRKSKRKVFVIKNNTQDEYNNLKDSITLPNITKSDDWISAYSHIGKRSNQQDAFCFSSLEAQNNGKAIAILSDGMGGLQGGEKASNICVNTIYNDFCNISDDIEYTPFLVSEIQKIDSLVCEIMDDEGNPVDSGATVLACIVDGDKLYWASVGDSHIYLVRNKTVQQLTKDHNYYQELLKKVESGEITQVNADNSDEKEALTSYIGINGVELIDFNGIQLELCDNDYILMCSDGLYRTISDEEIVSILYQYNDNIEIAARMLVRTVIDKHLPNQDNTTAVVIKYEKKKES